MNEIEKTIETYNKIAPEYCRKTRQKKYLDWEEQYVKKLLDYCTERPAMILDVGCGDGRHCRLIDKNGGRSVGIDLSESMIAVAKRYYPEGDFRLMNMIALDFGAGSFDGIWSSGSIYHVSKNELRTVLAEFARVLKVAGVLALNFKLGTGEGMETNPASYGGAPRYFAYYENEEMTETLNRYGFIELESTLYPERIYSDRIQQIWFRLKNVNEKGEEANLP
jgi:ubiquinone/menaquinone biosynthesis C-methylase UbiE